MVQPHPKSRDVVQPPVFVTAAIKIKIKNLLQVKAFVTAVSGLQH